MRKRCGCMHEGDWDVGSLQGSAAVALCLEVLVTSAKCFVFVGQGDLGQLRLRAVGIYVPARM